MTAAAWWTRADEAELGVLIWAFVDGFSSHRERCLICSTGYRWCVHATRAFDLLVDWQRFRELKTRAETLRRFEEAA